VPAGGRSATGRDAGYRSESECGGCDYEERRAQDIARGLDQPHGDVGCGAAGDYDAKVPARCHAAVIGLVGFAVLTYPAMAVMNNGLLIAGLAFLLIVVNTVGTQVGSYTLLPRLFQTEFRYTALSGVRTCPP